MGRYQSVNFLLTHTVYHGFNSKSDSGCVATGFAYRVGSIDLEVDVVWFQEFVHHLQETLHKEVEALGVARQEKLVQGLHWN